MNQKQAIGFTTELVDRLNTKITSLEASLREATEENHRRQSVINDLISEKLDLISQRDRLREENAILEDQIFESSEYIEDRSKELFHISSTDHDFWNGESCERMGKELQKILSILTPKEKE